MSAKDDANVSLTKPGGFDTRKQAVLMLKAWCLGQLSLVFFGFVEMLEQLRYQNVWDGPPHQVGVVMMGPRSERLFHLLFDEKHTYEHNLKLVSPALLFNFVLCSSSRRRLYLLPEQKAFLNGLPDWQFPIIGLPHEFSCSTKANLQETSNKPFGTQILKWLLIISTASRYP